MESFNVLPAHLSFASLLIGHIESVQLYVVGGNCLSALPLVSC